MSQALPHHHDPSAFWFGMAVLLLALILIWIERASGGRR